MSYRNKAAHRQALVESIEDSMSSITTLFKQLSNDELVKLDGNLCDIADELIESTEAEKDDLEEEQ